MSTNIEMNIMQSTGQYEVVYPQTTTENIVDIQNTLNNYFTKTQTLQNNTSQMFGLSFDAVPDDVFSLLSKAVFYKKILGKTQLKYMDPGTLFLLNEGGEQQQFVLLKKNYNESLNGAGRCLVARIGSLGTYQWDSADTNTYSSSSIDELLCTIYLNKFDPDVITAIGETSFLCSTYSAGSSAGSYSTETIKRAVFLPCLEELGISGTSLTDSLGDVIDTDVAVRVLENAFSSSNTKLWTRNVQKYTSIPLVAYAMYVNWSPSNWNTGYGARVTSNNLVVPVFTLPETFEVSPISEDLTDINDNLLLKLPGVQIETGSYVGTGTGGRSNPNTIKTDGSILGVLVTGYWGTNTYEYSTVFMDPNMGKYGGVSPGGTAFFGNVESVSGGIEWYSDGLPTQYPQTQGNVDGQKYCYIVLKRG